MIFYKTDKQQYDAWLHWNISSQCNFNCSYCFGKTSFVKQTINHIQIEKLLETLNKTGKIFRISFTGGEPFLIPNMVEAGKVLTDKHYISFNSNLVLPSVKYFSEVIDPERVLFIHASLHLKELQRANLIDKFVENFLLLKEKGFKVFAEAVAELSLTAEEIYFFNKELEKYNIKFSFGPFIGNCENKHYPESYTDEELKKFDLISENFSKHKQFGNLCNAGFNAAVVYPSGNVHPCFQIKNKLGNIYSEIKFQDDQTKCPAGYCDCPINYYDEYLASKILKK